jgi:N-acyl-D-amino-acid deacylase
MFDIVIRNGSIVDDGGSAFFLGDVGIIGNKIAAVGTQVGEGKVVIDAAGKLVTPGFVDVHTHYDAQAMWDPIIAPSSWHGITTVVIGNFGVGFAPVMAARRSWMMDIMQDVEEVPKSVLEAGLSWNWETFPQYMDELDSVRRTVDVGAQIPYIALRAYVMGDRAKGESRCTPHEVATMASLIKDGLQAGAVGFSCSRTDFHRLPNGDRVPGSMGDREELLQLADAVKAGGHGPIQILSDLNPATEEFHWMEQMSLRSGAPVGFTLIQNPLSDKGWRWQLDRIESSIPGASLVGHISPRGVGVVAYWRGAIHPFMARPSWLRISQWAWADQLATLKDPIFRQSLLSEADTEIAQLPAALRERFLRDFYGMFELGATSDYEPDSTTSSLAARATHLGISPSAYAYELLMANEGTGMIYIPIVNYDDGNLEFVRELIAHPNTVISLSDAGAHVTRIIDASAPTFVLTHWARDRCRGEQLSIETVVSAYTRKPAVAYGFNDRGVLAAGYLADLNVIHFDRLKLLPPYLAQDLPAGGSRLLPRAEGFDFTVKSGKITFRNGQHTGELPGRVIRGPQQLN